jgi:predicted MFS family arabinose efflux permease
LALCGSGVAAIVLPPWTVWIIGEWGWRTAYLALATLPLVIALPVTYWLLPTAAQRPSSTVAPTEPKSAEKNDFEVKEALMSYRFWLLMASTMLLGFAISGTIPNIIPLLIDIGVSAPTAAGLMGVFGISLIIGRLSAGYTLDFVWAPAVAAVMFPLAALACALLSTGVTDYAVLVMSIFLFGIATGAEFDLIPYIITRYFGLKRYGQIYALQWVGWTVFSGVAPTIYGYIFDVSGSYRGALYAAIACFLVAPVLVLFLGRYPKRDVLTPQQA